MGKNELTRSYLETLSSTDLIALSDDYGIEAENLTRRFIITEILDLLEEQKSTTDDLEEKTVDSLELPFSYNENKIIAVLRNPAWCYVTWDFKQETYLSYLGDPSFESFVIRFSYHKDTETDEVADTFDIQINQSDREQFFLLSSDLPAFHVSLLVTFDDKEKEVLATSQRILKARIPLDISLENIQKTCPTIQSLSGLQSILKSHYNEHRHSFVRD